MEIYNLQNLEIFNSLNIKSLELTFKDFDYICESPKLKLPLIKSLSLSQIDHISAEILKSFENLNELEIKNQ